MIWPNLLAGIPQSPELIDASSPVFLTFFFFHFFIFNKLRDLFRSWDSFQIKTDERACIELFVKYAACILSRVYINVREIFMKISNLIFEFFCALELILLVKFRKSQTISFLFVQ